MTVIDDPDLEIETLEPGDQDGSDGSERTAKLKHTRASRWMHWINFPVLTIMIWSGMRIYWADLQDPFAVGVGDLDFEFWPKALNQKLGLKSVLARGMAFHFTFGWFFALNGLAYGLYLWRSGEWRQLIPERGSWKDSTQVFLHDIGIGRSKPLPPQARYNGAQRITYTLVLFMGAVVVLTGFAIYKPTQLSPLTRLFGGYEWARGIHFATTIGFLIFFVIHILQVLRSGFSNFASMVTGYELDPKPGSRRDRRVQKQAALRAENDSAPQEESSADV